MVCLTVIYLLMFFASHITVEQVAGQLPQRLFGVVGSLDSVEVPHSVVVELRYALFDGVAYVEAVVYVKHFVDFGCRVLRCCGEEFAKPLLLVAVALLEGGEQQEGFFVVFDVGACLFAEGGGVAIGVEKVVAQLEGEAGVDAEVIEFFSIALVGVGIERADFEGSGEEHGGLESDHLHIFIDGDVVAAFEVHIELLPLVDLQAGVAEGLQDGLQVFVGLPDEVTPGEDVHCVAREDCRILVPFAVDGGLAAPHRRAVHKVVVEQSEIVECFNADGSKACLLDVATEEVGGGEEHHGPDAFAALCEGVDDGVV